MKIGSPEPELILIYFNLLGSNSTNLSISCWVIFPYIWRFIEYTKSE